MTPGWNDVLRFAPGTALRMELALAPALREAIEKASATATACLRGLEGATLWVQELSPTVCRLRCEAEGMILALHASAGDLHACAHFNSRTRELSWPRLRLQTGGRHDAYIALADMPATPFVHLRYGDDARASLSVFTAALAPLLAPGHRAWLLPARLQLLRLVVFENTLRAA